MTDVQSDPGVDVHPSLLCEEETTRPQMRADAMELRQVGWLHTCMWKLNQPRIVISIQNTIKSIILLCESISNHHYTTITVVRLSARVVGPPGVKSVVSLQSLTPHLMAH